MGIPEDLEIEDLDSLNLRSGINYQGRKKCKEILEHEKVQKEFLGPQCMIKYLDLGIAVGSAAAKAKDLCVDNRAKKIPELYNLMLSFKILDRI